MKHIISNKTWMVKGSTVLLLAVIFTFISCEFNDDLPEAGSIADATPPTSFFTFTAGTGVSDFTRVVFANESDNATSYSWDFGDGNTSTDLDPINTFPGQGTYTVTLTVSDALEQTATYSEDIVIVQPPASADFNFVAAGLTVDFTDNSIFAVSYSWDFGDGNTSTDMNPTHTYLASGAYDVTLTIADVNGVMADITKEVNVGVQSTFDAVIQNADMESYPTAEMNNNDLVDAWTIDPDNSFNDGTASTFNFWRNDALEAWVSNPVNNGGSGTTDKGSSSGTDAQSAGGTSGRSLKFDSSGERAYQPFEVELAVSYSISAFVKTESTPVGDVEGTFYILSGEPTSDNDLTSLTLASQEVVSNGIDTWQQISFNFSASATFNFPQSRVDENTNDILTSTSQRFVILYFVPTNTVTGSNEVFLTDIVIDTL
ncbi:MAG: PKD domain-containing protein [Bacteroidota bacterium]